MFKQTKFLIDAPEITLLKIVLDDFAVNTANVRKTAPDMVLLELYKDINKKHHHVTKESTMKLMPSQAFAALELLESPSGSSTIGSFSTMHVYNNMYNRLDQYRTTFDILDPFDEARDEYKQKNNPLLEWTKE